MESQTKKTLKQETHDMLVRVVSQIRLVVPLVQPRQFYHDQLVEGLEKAMLHPLVTG